MTLNSGQPSFAPPDPAVVLAGTGLDARSVIVALDALRAAGCLRERPGDFPPAPPGVMVLNDVRVVDFMPTDDRLTAELGTATRYGLHVSRGSTFSDVLGLLSLVTHEVNVRRTQELGE